jgi:hypothetical protein
MSPEIRSPLGSVLAAVVAASVPLAPSASQAASYNFVLAPPPPPKDSVNSSQASFMSVGDINVKLTIFDSNSVGSRNNSTVNFNNMYGLCAWTSVGTTGFGRCGYGVDPAGSVSAFTFRFDEDVVIRSFNVSSFSSQELSQGTVRFSRDQQTFVDVSFSSPGEQSLDFHAPANQAIRVSSSGIFAPGNPYSTGLIRIDTLNVTPVPAPMAASGPAALYYFSRKLSSLRRVGRSRQSSASRSLERQARA